MPASMITACVALSPNVTGSRIEMPDSGPMPGSTPTSVPTRQPSTAYQRFSGCERDRETVHQADEGGLHAQKPHGPLGIGVFRHIFEADKSDGDD